MWGIIREKVWLENNLSPLEGGLQGRSGSEYINRLWWVMTHMEATGEYVKRWGACRDESWDGRGQNFVF
jgi:hypothetical protein